MAKKRQNRFSRTRLATYQEEDGYEFWDLTLYPELQEQTRDIIHTIRAGERIDHISYRYYKTALLWWVIALANDLELIPSELSNGDEIRIPAPTYVVQKYLRQKR